MALFVLVQVGLLGELLVATGKVAVKGLVTSVDAQVVPKDVELSEALLTTSVVAFQQLEETPSRGVAVLENAELPCAGDQVWVAQNFRFRANLTTLVFK